METIETQLAAAVDKLASTTKDYEAALCALEKSEAMAKELQSAVTAKDAEIAKLCADIQAKDASIAERDEQLAAADKKAATIVAAAGVPPIAASTATGNATDLRAQYHALLRTNPEAAAKFYTANRAKF